jgi:hypothetical protein
VTNAVTPADIFKVGFGFWASKTLLSAVELGLFTELAKSPADLASLSRRLGLHDRSARDFLDALVALKMLDRQDGRYRRRICFWTGRSQATLAGFSKWPIPGFMVPGVF